MENLEHLLKNKYEPKRIECLDWIRIIQNKLNTHNSTFIHNLEENEFNDLVSEIARKELLKVPKKYKNEFKELIPKISNAFYSFRERVFNGLTVTNDNEGVLDIILSFSSTPVFKSNYHEFTTRLGLSNLVESKFIQSSEYQKLLEYLKVNDDIAGLLFEICNDYENKFYRQQQKTLDIFTEFQKLYNSLTTKQRKLLIDKKTIKNEYLDVLNDNLELRNANENIKKQRGTINQFFGEWENRILNVQKGERENYYENEFKKDKPELKDIPYRKFNNNFKVSKSKDRKALKGNRKG